MPHILVVDDKEMMRDSLEATFSGDGYQVTTASDAIIAIDLAKKASFDAVITDLKMPKMDGLQLLDEIKKIQPDLPVVMMTAYATVDTAVEAMRKGAYDYIQKPFEADEIILLINRLIEHQQAMKENQAYRTSDRDWQRGRQLVGAGSAMQQVLDEIDRIAPTTATVFIRGESGTGKEMIARAIHAKSRRSNKPMLCVNCAALSSNLLESELFGHEKGAFTGADQKRIGRFELADGGALLLDEISEMNLELQAKLLRVLQEREFERVGSSVTRRVDVRVIATTNRDLLDWVKQGKFREDLYYRLNVVPIVLPPLRHRREDIDALCEYFMQRYADRENAPLKIISRDALDLLKSYHWPGNVRELENLMERVAILADNDVITADTIKSWITIDPKFRDTENFDHAMTLEDMERRLVCKTLSRFKGHRQKTADALGIAVRTLGMKIKRWNIEQTSST